MENSLLAIFHEIPCTMVLGQIFEQLKKFIKNLILIGITDMYIALLA